MCGPIDRLIFYSGTQNSGQVEFVVLLLGTDQYYFLADHGSKPLLVQYCPLVISAFQLTSSTIAKCASLILTFNTREWYFKKSMDMLNGLFPLIFIPLEILNTPVEMHTPTAEGMYVNLQYRECAFQ